MSHLMAVHVEVNYSPQEHLRLVTGDCRVIHSAFGAARYFSQVSQKDDVTGGNLRGKRDRTASLLMGIM